jgi:hypothetical protein
MANSLVSPQHGDEPDAAFLATLAGDTRAPGALVNGFAFTVDYGTPALDVTAGKAFVARSSMTTASRTSTRRRASTTPERSSSTPVRPGSG